MTLGGNKKRVGGFSLLEVLIVIAALAALIVVFLPRFARARRHSGPNCTNNLKQVGLSFRQWGMDHNDKYPDQVSVTNGGTMELVGSGIAYVHFLVLSNELNTPRVLICTAETNRIAATNWSSFRNGNLSYFAGLNVSETNPQLILSGDDNFTVNGVKPKRGVLDLWTNSTIAWLPTRHVRQGNVALADGSVQGFDSPRFLQALFATGVSTNRLSMP